LVLFSRFLVLKMCSRARVWAIRAELDPTQVQLNCKKFNVWIIWHFK
jgi:hypothetical protein